jgi:hypothetical protein
MAASVPVRGSSEIHDSTGGRGWGGLDRHSPVSPAILGQGHFGSKPGCQENPAAFIRQWKINQALYRQYGGRIIYQQGGPEPLDAYRTFLQARERQGAFKILNPAFEAEFWKYFLTDSIHSFYPKGSQEEAQAFETPWWLLSVFEKTKTQ